MSGSSSLSAPQIGEVATFDIHLDGLAVAEATGVSTALSLEEFRSQKVFADAIATNTVSFVRRGAVVATDSEKAFKLKGTLASEHGGWVLKLCKTPAAGSGLAAANNSISIEQITDAVRGAVRNVLNEDRVSNISISKISSSQANRLLELIGLSVVEEQIAVDVPTAKFKPHKWRYHTEDAAMTKDICDHLFEQLQEHKLTGRGKFSLHDVHASSKTMFAARFGKYPLVGGVDAVIVPHKVSTYGSNTTLRVILEWKTHDKLDFASIYAQAVAELMAAAAVSKHPVLGVVTDLATKAHLFRVVGSVLVVYRDLSVQRAFDYIVMYLKTSSTSVEFDPQTQLTLEMKALAFDHAVESATKIKGHLSDNELLTQIEAVIDPSEPSWERYETASYLLDSWYRSGNLTYYS